MDISAQFIGLTNLPDGIISCNKTQLDVQWSWCITKTRQMLSLLGNEMLGYDLWEFVSKFHGSKHKRNTSYWSYLSVVIFFICSSNVYIGSDMSSHILWGVVKQEQDGVINEISVSFRTSVINFMWQHIVFIISEKM